MKNSHSLSFRLKRLRKALHWTLRQMGKEFGVVHGAISMWEKGARPIPGPVVKLIELYEEELGLYPSKKEEKSLKQESDFFCDANHSSASPLSQLFIQIFSDFLVSIFKSNLFPSRIAQKGRKAVFSQIAKILSRLKGLSMKIGQALSYFPFLASSEVRKVFSEMLSLSQPMEKSALSNLFLEEFKSTPQQLFSHWSVEPFAVASIGQVHLVRLSSGKEVAVKVQYPHIAKAIRNDLKNIRFLDHLIPFLFKGQKRGSVYEELKERLEEECDYRKEARFQETFREAFIHHPRMTIPRVFLEYTTRRVLTMELCSGKRFEEFSKSASQKHRNQAGEIIFEFAMTSLMKYVFINADPHPGNYLFDRDKVVFLDFGCVKRYRREFILQRHRLCRAVLDQDDSKIDQLTAELGFTPKPESFDFAYYRRALKFLFEPWLMKRPFQFSESYVKEAWKRVILHHPSRFSANIPRDYLFFECWQWGLYSVLALLQAKANWRKKLEQILEEGYLPLNFKEFNDSKKEKKNAP